VARPRLEGWLDEGLARGPILVWAPAGFGKTSLLADWAGVPQRSVAWLSLDAGDNDPAAWLLSLPCGDAEVVDRPFDSHAGEHGLGWIGRVRRTPRGQEHVVGAGNRVVTASEPVIKEDERVALGVRWDN
jgi:hypothetical protein